MIAGRHIKLTKQEVDDAIREHALRLARSRGVQGLPDSFDLKGRGVTHVVTFAEHGNAADELKFDGALVSWSDA